MPELKSELGMSLLAHCLSSEADISIIYETRPAVAFRWPPAAAVRRARSPYLQDPPADAGACASFLCF